MPGDQEKEKDKSRKVRGGHRGFVKRTVSLCDDLIVKGDLSKDEKDRIVNYRKTLTEKQKVLKILDDEILDKMTDDDNIEAEIFESSEFSEFIFDAVSRIDNVLQAPSQPNIADRLMNSTDDRSHGSRSPSSDSDQSTQNLGQDTRLQSNSRIRAKLPKLTLDKYSGDAKQWQSFWDSFSSAIDSNPELSKVDKFSYLKSLLEGPAQSAISGITLTGDNYDSAIKLLTERFANPQVIISSHMESMISLKSVSDSNDIKKLRTLYDGIESSIRNLNSLGISSDSFGALLIPLILQKIPEDFTLLITREFKSDTWSFSEFLHGMKLEIEAREKCAFMKSKEPNQTKSTKSDDFHKYRYKHPTSATLFTDQQTGNNMQQGPFCSFCAKQHSSASCKTVTEISARKNILRKKGKCFRCLKTGHIIKNCPVSFKCFNCQGDHNAARCDRSKENTATGYKDQKQSNTMCVNSDTSVLLQTAVTDIGSPDRPNPKKSRSRLVFDNCSQRTYVTEKLCNRIKSKSIREDNLLIKSFGDESPRLKPCQLVQLSVTTRDGMEVYVSAYKVPTICSPISNQAIDIALDNYPYLHGLDLADNPNASDADELEVDLLIGADYYWTFFNGVSRRGEHNGPVALYSKLGWVLSGPVVTSCRNSRECTVNLSSTHVLKIDSSIVSECDMYDIKQELSKFWDLETLGIRKNETSVYDKFIEDVKFNRERYEVQLPFKEEHSLLPDNFNVCQNRLEKLLKRLKFQPQIREEYDRIIKDQLNDGIIELVPEQELSTPSVGNVHYLPHREVVRTDKDTTKVRIVYDASAKVNNSSPSLNDCLFSGPSLIPLIFDILVRFRVNRIAVIADIEKAFLNISVVPEHRDFLRFLWVSDPNSDNPNVIVYRFARVVFGVTSSPFLLNATLRHHLNLCESDENSDFIREISESLYVDDFASGSGSVNETFEKCKAVRNIFKDGAFNMRKWVSNSAELLQRINNDLLFQEKIKPSNQQTVIVEEDEGYSNYYLAQESFSHPKVLGLIWDNKSDNFVYDFSKIANCNESDTVTKRTVLSIASKFYDPLGLISPIVLSFKLLFQKLCTLEIDWDDQLDDDFVSEWKNLLSKLQKTSIVEIPRCYCIDICDNSGIELHVFGDASERAFGTCIYLRCNHETFIHSNLIASKTRVAPLSKQTMPRLELLACLISAQLAVSVVKALHHLTFDQIYYWSDSQVALSWIRNVNKEYKQFVQNRVTEIRKISTIENWNYCSTLENPADIASRGSTSTELANNIKWWNGPQYLLLPKEEWPNQSTFEQTEQLDTELKAKSMSVVSCVASSKNNQSNLNLEDIIPLTKFSSLSTLLRVTAYVLRYVHNLKCCLNQSRSDHKGDLSLEELKASENLWIKDIQYHITRDDKFEQRKVSLNLKEDISGILRCYGRIEHSNLEYDAKNPVFLPEKHYFTYLQILKSHQDVMHNGVQETLSQLRSKFWVVRGRQIVRSIISKCVVCRRLEAKSYGTPIQPPLPAFRISDDFAFSHIGIDYAGPLFVRDIYTKSEDMHKVYIVVYTCASSRAIHLDLAPDASSTSFIRSFKRFIGRRGIPTSVISDNGKTFKGVELKSFNLSKNIRWRFNVERSPWWGGFFERMVRSVKRCLKKSLGTSRLTYEELLTLLIQIEGVLNSRPLTYLCEDGGETLTPSQLVIGRRLLSEPVETLEPNIHALSSFTRRKYLKTVLEHFWNRWKREYLTELREHHKFNKSKGQSVRVGDVVLVFEDKIPRHNWNIARIERTLEGRDGNIRSAVIRMLDKSGKPILMNRPIQKLYPIELSDN